MKLDKCHIGQTVGITVDGDKYIGEVLISKLMGVLK